MNTMRGVTLRAEWAPRDGFTLGAKDVEERQTYLGSRVWRNPRLSIEDYPIPEPGEGQVLVQVRACGICGSDVHMAQPDPEGYIYYPGLTGFPTILGHELSGVVVKAGRNALSKETGRPFQGGELVCTEEMFWCGACRPCADGYLNHCEHLNEIGFNVNGAFADYVLLPAKLLWSLAPLRKVYTDERDIFLAGSLVEPTSVAYNAVIQRGGGVRPGDNVVICGGGPVGLAAVAILKRQGAARVILSEPQDSRAEIGRKLGADAVINPQKENFTARVLELTGGMGAKLYLEATGLPDLIYPTIENTIWEGRVIDSTVVVVARADATMPVTGEVLQVRGARIVGAQGHSGSGTFPHVIASMASGMDMLPLITKQITLDEVPEHIIRLRTDRRECKITCVMGQ
ncbi:MAG: alcohol dehydrogenase catalytic domain-containing protein [Oscillospiraceae bacterium]|nr:alcohol dehydrogenase catalytic domain-containing protein [Oscillospiraceae bacterium]